MTATTQEGYKYTLRILKDHFGRRKLAEIKTMDVEQFLRKLRKDGRASSYIAQCRGMLHQIMNKAVANDFLVKNPVAFAEKMRTATGSTWNPSVAVVKHLTTDQAEWVRSQPQIPVSNYVVPRIHHLGVDSASGDIGDVSYVCPTAEIYTATWAAGTSAHTWQATAQGKSSLAHKAMLFAGKVLAGAAIDLFNDPQKLELAKKEHAEITGNKPFVSPIPKDVPLPKG